mgnify:CR=1 FL=1
MAEGGGVVVATATGSDGVRGKRLCRARTLPTSGTGGAASAAGPVLPARGWQVQIAAKVVWGGPSCSWIQNDQTSRGPTHRRACPWAPPARHQAHPHPPNWTRPPPVVKTKHRPSRSDAPSPIYGQAAPPKTKTGSTAEVARTTCGVEPESLMDLADLPLQAVRMAAIAPRELRRGKNGICRGRRTYAA